MAFLNLLITIGNMLLRGHLIQVFWAWFVLSQFPTAPHISFFGGLGLSLMVYLFGDNPINTLDAQRALNKEHDIKIPFIKSCATTLILLSVWLSGWVFHHFMS